MKNNMNEDSKKFAFSSNPEKSFEAGKKGGKPALDTLNQSSSTFNSSKSSGSSTSSGEFHSRVSNTRRPVKGEGWQSDRVGSKDSGSKNMPNP